MNGEANVDRGLSSVTWNSKIYLSDGQYDNKYLGYMYGGINGEPSTSKEQAQTNETNTNIKIQLESWYKTNITDKNLDNFIADSIFCNDRSFASNNTGLGYGKSATGYATAERHGLFMPSFKCNQKNDAFTKIDTINGNGALNEKIGLITSDEAIAAGTSGYNVANLKYYLYKGFAYWTMSPRGYYERMDRPFRLHSNGSLYCSTNTGGSYRMVPVINLIPKYATQMIGDGTIGNEYRVE